MCITNNNYKRYNTNFIFDDRNIVCMVSHIKDLAVIKHFEKLILRHGVTTRKILLLSKVLIR